MEWMKWMRVEMKKKKAVALIQKIKGEEGE